MDKKTIKLGNGKTITMREPLVRDTRAVSHLSDDVEREIAMIGNLCELAPEEVEALTMRDYGLLQDALVGFMMPATKPE
jgi:hypothetical protein